ncbi:uncharacterized protein LOC144451015 [Glandiceps talaboti]
MSSAVKPEVTSSRTVPDTRKVVPFDPCIHKSLSAVFDTGDEPSIQRVDTETHNRTYVDLARRKLLTLLLGLLLAAIVIAVVVGVLQGTKSGKNQTSTAMNLTKESSQSL